MRYEAHFSCSGPPAKKGYAGTAVYIRKGPNAAGSGGSAAAAKPTAKKKKQGGISAFFKPVKGKKGAEQEEKPDAAEEQKPAAAASAAVDDGPPALEVLGVTEGILDATALAESHDLWHDEGRALTVEYVYTSRASQPTNRTHARTHAHTAV